MTNELKDTDFFKEWTEPNTAHTPVDMRQVGAGIIDVLLFIRQSGLREDLFDPRLEHRAIARETAELKSKLEDFFLVIPFMPFVEQLGNYLGIMASVVLCEDPKIEKKGTIALFYALSELATFDPVSRTLPLAEMSYVTNPQQKEIDFPEIFALSAQRIFRDAYSDIASTEAISNLFDFDRLNPLITEDEERVYHAYMAPSFALQETSARSLSGTGRALVAPTCNLASPDGTTVRKRVLNHLHTAPTLVQ